MISKVEEFKYLSSDKEHHIYAKIWMPDCDAKGVIQISHGMNGYIGKYDSIAKVLNDAGFIVCGNTHLGHLDSINNPEDLGFFGEFNGAKYLVSDLYKMTKIIKEKYPDKKLFLFGHSMGSFIARNYIYKHADEIDGLIVSATAGPQLLEDSGIRFLNAIIEKNGYRFRSEKIYRILFKSANRRIENPKNDYAWISKRSEEFVTSLTKSVFTVTGLRDLVILIRDCNSYKKIEKLSKELPMFFFSGMEDPLGQYGEGVKHAVKLYQKAGIEDVTLKLYNGCRHECFSDEKKDVVLNNMIKWIEKRI